MQCIPTDTSLCTFFCDVGGSDEVSINLPTGCTDIHALVESGWSTWDEVPFLIGSYTVRLID